MSGDTATEHGHGLVESLNPLRLPLRHKLGLLGLVLLALLPLGQLVGITAVTVLGVLRVTLSPEPLTLLKLTAALYFGMFAMSWDVVSGYTGQISFGHGLFFGIGGYTSAVLNLQHGVDPLLSIPAGIVLAAVAGVIIGVPALRLHGPYLSLVTLVAPLILLQLFIMFNDSLVVEAFGVTIPVAPQGFGGELGLGSPANLFGFGLGDAVAVYYTALAAFAFVLALLLAVTRSDAGVVLTAIREDEIATAAIGINPAKFKTFAFVLSAAVGGLAGAMLVHTPVGNPQPSQLLVLTVSIEVIIASILGGMGTIVGAAAGGIFLMLLRDFLSNVEWVIPGVGAPVSEMDFLLFAVFTLVLLFVLPGGFVRWGIRLGRQVLGSVRGRAADGGRDDPPRSRPPSDTGRSPVEQVCDRYAEEIRAILEGDDERR